MKEKKRRKIKASIKIALLITILILLVFLTIFATNSLEENINIKTTTYQDNGSLTPSICLKNNDFLEATCTQDNKSYVTSLINNINISLNDTLTSSNILSTDTYQYKIEAEVIANEKGDSSKVVYDNTTILDSGNYSTQNDTGYSISKTVKIDFQDYNKTITDFKKNYVLALDSNLIIKATITSNAIIDDSKDNIDSNKTISITFPLSEQTVNMDLDNSTYNKQETKVETIQDDSFPQKKQALNILYIIDVLVILFTIYIMIKLKPKKDEYKAKLERIEKEYDRAIAITMNIPSFKDLKVIRIDSFEELLDVKDNLDKPILLYENKKISKATFFIITSHEAYIYILDAYDE